MKKIRNPVRAKVTVRRPPDGTSGTPQTTNSQSVGDDDRLARRPTLESDAKRQTPGISTTASAEVLDDLRSALDRVTAGNHPRTFKFLRSGSRKLARKLIEEACEVTVEAVKRDKAGIVLESADLLYQLVLLWFRSGVEPRQVWQEMQRRADVLGIAEKLPKCADDRIASTTLHH
jgi:phosphoribosyl-ATP pyrophosphohydrolase